MRLSDEEAQLLTDERDALRQVANLRTCLGMIAWARKTGRDDVAEFYAARGRLLRDYLRETVPELDA